MNALISGRFNFTVTYCKKIYISVEICVRQSNKFIVGMPRKFLMVFYFTLPILCNSLSQSRSVQLHVLFRKNINQNLSSPLVALDIMTIYIILQHYYKNFALLLQYFALLLQIFALLFAINCTEIDQSLSSIICVYIIIILIHVFLYCIVFLLYFHQSGPD